MAADEKNVEIPSVEVVGLKKSFGDFVALHGVSAQIGRNEFFSLLGPSGCGKTTLMRIIGGFESPTEGDVLIHGQSVVDLPPYRRRTNMVFQHLALFPHLSVVQNIMFPLEMKREEPAVVRKKALAMLEMVRLSGMHNRKIHELSGGQKQRVAIARALVSDPDVVLLDEPLGALDLKLRLQMQDELRRLQKEVGSTFIFVTHDQSEAITMSDRIAVMQAGHIVQIGTPFEIYEEPASRFVADFIGHSNIFTATITQDLGAGRYAAEGDGVRLVGKCRSQATVGQSIAVTIRYESINISRSTDSACANRFDAVVADRKYLGSATRLKLTLPSGRLLQADLSPTAVEAGVDPGERVSVLIEPDQVRMLVD